MIDKMVKIPAIRYYDLLQKENEFDALVKAGVRFKGNPSEMKSDDDILDEVYLKIIV